jgi:hypothetical protein
MNALRGYFQPASKKPAKKHPNNSTKAQPTAVAPTAVSDNASARNSGISTPNTGRHGSASSTSTLFPEGDFRNAPPENVLDVKADVMVSWLHQQQAEKMWIRANPSEGVVLKKTRGRFTCCPEGLRNDPLGFFDQIVAMNVRVSF